VAVIGTDDSFLQKAEESLAGAESEFVNSRYNNAANRCYYACFQAAIHALIAAGIQPAGGREEWGHDFVQAQFNGQLINRRKLYPAALRGTLDQNYRLRVVADYWAQAVGETRAIRAIRRTKEFLERIRARG
jgi:uncharacterized protein (UPF0332 family)